MSNLSAQLPAVPGVYFEPRPRAPAVPLVRTDVVGFVGFEPRVSNGTAPSRLIGETAEGHEFNVDIAGFYVDIGSTRRWLPAVINLSLSADTDSTPIEDGQGIVYSLVAARNASDTIRLIVFPSLPASRGHERPLADNEIRVDDPAWVRIADVSITRAGRSVYVTVVPTLPPTRLEDWNDYVLRFGLPRPDGTLLAAAVRAFFANGGRRCYVTTVRRPDFADTAGLQQALDDMVGIKGSSEHEVTGLERLLLIPEVSIVDVPDLHAERAQDPPPAFELPPVDVTACFVDCGSLHAATSATALGRSEGSQPLFNDAEVQNTQTRLLYRSIDERWRVFLLLNVPSEYDPAMGHFRRPSKEKAIAWREYFASLGEGTQEMSCAGLYFPWLLAQERVDAPVVEMPSTPFVAGIIARRDLTRGPHVSPANETVRGVIGVTWPIDDQVNGELYEPSSNINILRPFAGYGIQLWGARTLSSDFWLRYVAVRRCLSAIERRAVFALQPLVFEPNTPMLWLQVSQLMLDILLPLFESGALRGKRPDEAFYIRCDASVNPPEQIEQGMLVCEVGVAIAAPAEFIVFRLGRREGVVEVME